MSALAWKLAPQHPYDVLLEPLTTLTSANTLAPSVEHERAPSFFAEVRGLGEIIVHPDAQEVVLARHLNHLVIAPLMYIKIRRLSAPVVLRRASFEENSVKT